MRVETATRRLDSEFQREWISDRETSKGVFEKEEDS